MLDETLSIFLSWKFEIKKVQQIAYNHSSDIDFQDFKNLYKECTAKPCCFLFIDATLATDNPLYFRKNVLERI